MTEIYLHIDARVADYIRTHLAFERNNLALETALLGGGDCFGMGGHLRIQKHPDASRNMARGNQKEQGAEGYHAADQ